jgi:hypothetical protein
MNSAFPARLPFEVFHRVGDVNLGTINASFLERTVHDFPSRTNEWFAGHIFVIARLFANQHHHCALRPFSKHSLGRSFVQMTRSAIGRGFAHRAKA